MVIVLRTLIQLLTTITLLPFPMELVPAPTSLESRYLAWDRYCHVQHLLVILSSSFLNTTMLGMLYVPLHHMLCNYSRIDRNIKRVENCLNTTGSSVNESDSFADELIVVR
ncbi:hypothetical protein QL285_088041 [Trifolium repens]|nr:hypothetical protein QL285_088041 [Trifolium repens]